MVKLNANYSNTKFQGQVKRAFKEFYRQPSTMLQVEHQTGIMRANLCRYVARWRRLGIIYLVEKAKCPISKMLAGFYSTDPKYASKAQLKMFE